MSGVTRDRKADAISRDHILRRKRNQEKHSFPVKLTMSRIDNHTQLIPSLLHVMAILNGTCIMLTVYLDVFCSTKAYYTLLKP